MPEACQNVKHHHVKSLHPHICLPEGKRYIHIPDTVSITQYAYLFLLGAKTDV